MQKSVSEAVCQSHFAEHLSSDYYITVLSDIKLKREIDSPTLKAYLRLIWSSGESTDIWKLGRSMLPSIPSSFSSVDI